jgi:acyl-coenzyme A synthetase/AMP-(fatty) acid ligase
MQAFLTQKEILLWLEKCFGNKEAIVDYPGGKRWTFGDLGDYSRRICASYKRDGLVGRGDRVSWLSLTPTTDIIALSFGARKMGAIPVIINARASLESVAWMINHVEVKSLAYSEECVDLIRRVREIGIPSVREYIALKERGGFPGEFTIDEIYDRYKAADEPGVQITEDDDCLVCYTSGTTGRPKPVLHKEGEWSWTSMMMAYQCGLYFDDAILNAMAPGFMGWAHVTCSALRVAAKQCCLRFEPSIYLQVVNDEKPTHGLISPTLVRMLYRDYRERHKKLSLDSLCIALVSGEPVTEDVIAMIKEMFPNLVRMSSIGATEAISMTTGPRNAYLREHWDTVGKPVPGMIAELRDTETGEAITEPDRPGELYVRGPGVASGIWNDPEATEKNFPGGWWKTGDLLFMDKNGYYYFAGRSDYMFKSGNIKVYSVEVEMNLKKHPAVLDAVVVPVPHETFGLVPFAHIRNREPLTAGEMESWWLGQGFARYNRPRKWRFWGEEEFPMITPIKIDRKKLFEMARQE